MRHLQKKTAIIIRKRPSMTSVRIIVKPFLLAACIALPAVAAAQSTPAPDPTGTWNATFNTQQGAIPATLKLQKSGDKLKGTIASQQGESQIEAEVKGTILTVWFNYPSNGQQIPVEMTGTIDGEDAKGTVQDGRK